jgi:aminoglycoside phosphotransferase (APT) family kinase protein
MTTLEKAIGQIAEGLLHYLKKELNNPEAGYDTSLTRLEGGFETFIYKFRLSGVQEELSKPLILRLFPEYHNSEKAVWESAVQNALADQGYPAPRVYFTCTEKSILGGAFFIMKFIEGENMLTGMFETFPERLGELHASLHKIDPGPVIKALEDQGIPEHQVRLDRKYYWLIEAAQNDCPWLGEGVAWLRENRPPEPKQPSICHGDFHPMNILVKDGEVTGVIDWPGFRIGDPVSDMAFTIALTAIHGGQFLSRSEIENVMERYVDSYLKQRPVSIEHIPYYRVLRCVIALREAAAGQEYWRLPHSVKGTTEYIHEITGIQITPPYYK